MRIGILGGTFDPPHIGHIALAEAAIEQLELDEVIFVPAHRNPSKMDKNQSSARRRLEMVRLALQDRKNLAYSDVEVVRGGPSYAVETMLLLAAAQPAEYWFLMGADALKDFMGWKQPEKLVRLCRLGVAVRTPDNPEDVLSRIPPEFRSHIDVISMKPVDVSATEIRDHLSRGLGVGQWVAPQVAQYIREHKLYRS